MLRTLLITLFSLLLFSSTTLAVAQDQRPVPQRQQQQQQQQRPPPARANANPPPDRKVADNNRPKPKPSPRPASSKPVAAQQQQQDGSGAAATANLANIRTPLCQSYSRTANLSTVGANSTYRSAFLSVSPNGGLYDRNMFNAEVLKGPVLMFDKSLNARCGNLTAIAIAEAAKNFTKGTVLEFSDIKPDPIFAGIILLPLIGAIAVLIMGSAAFS